jgi:hypothetical protein
MTGNSNELSHGEAAGSEHPDEHIDSLMDNPAVTLFEYFGNRDFLRHRKPLKPPVTAEETGANDGTIDNRT